MNRGKRTDVLLLRVNWTGDVLERMITHENAVDVDMLDVDGTPFPR